MAFATIENIKKKKKKRKLKLGKKEPSLLSGQRLLECDFRAVGGLVPTKWRCVGAGTQPVDRWRVEVWREKALTVFQI